MTAVLSVVRWGLLLLGLAVLVLLVLLLLPLKPSEKAPLLALPPEPSEASEDEVRPFCGACHVVPPPDSFPRREWRKQVRQAYEFYRDSPRIIGIPSLESVALYYETHASEELPSLIASSLSPLAARWEQRGIAPPTSSLPAVTHLSLARLTARGPSEILVCDSRRHEVLALNAITEPPTWRVLGSAPAPARVEVVDLDRDGILDLLVACLGEFYPTDAPVGRVVWLRGKKDNTYDAVTLLESVGRVADVRAADFRGTGKLDLLVAVFGWQKTGEVLLLENATDNWAKPKFTSRVLDARHGPIHVPIADLNRDGRPDFVVLVSQEHEEIVAHLNEGGSKFRTELLYRAPHPAFGSSGIQLVDLEGDGDLDVLYANGDILDPPHLLRPDHQIHWLENQTEDWGRPRYVAHSLALMPGVTQALAADVDNDGDLDVLAVSFLPPERVGDRPAKQLASVVLLEQQKKREFVRHALALTTCDHFACAVGDVYGDGRPHLVTGNFAMSTVNPLEDAVILWKRRHQKQP